MNNKSKPYKLTNVSTGSSSVDTLYQTAIESVHCETKLCTGSLMKQTTTLPSTSSSSSSSSSCPMSNPSSTTTTIKQHRRTCDEILFHAKNFLDQYYTSIKRLNSPAHVERWTQVSSSIVKHGTYQLKETELIFGAKLAWRNASRCIGRIQWSKLQVFDVRTATTAKEMFDAICNHIKYATNKGNLRSAITIFPQRTGDSGDFRIWNQQLISYAGYHDPDRPGHTIGDPINIEFTQLCVSLGWKPPRTNWDILPIVVSASGQDPQLFVIPEELILRVPLEHPNFKWFADLELQWYAVPAVSNMLFDVGGIEFPAAPFSGWYMVTEIACRDLCDPNRYNILKTVADKMGLDTRSNMTLWKDAALVEVNRAVIDSFHKLGVTIVDHHTAAESFMKHLENEQRLRGGCPADWVWIVPPTAGSLTPVFHQEMLDYRLKPSFEYQEPAWKSHSWNSSPNGEKSMIQGRKKKFKEIARAVKFTSNLFGKALSKRVKATILYATETGRSEEYAKRLEQIFSFAFNVTVMPMDSYDIFQLEHETLLLIVTSTFGNGDPPENGESFARQLQAIKVTGDTTPDIESVSIHNGNSLELEKLKLESDVTSKIILEDGKLLKESDFKKTEITKSENSLQSTGHFTSHQAYKQFCRSKRRRFAVFGLGSSAYPNFCAFAKYLDNMLGELGGERIFKLVTGDELCGQEQSFNQWSKDVFAEACNVFCLSDEINMNDVMKTATLKPKIWSVQSVKLVPLTVTPNGPKSSTDVTKALAKSSNRKVIPFRLVSTVALHKGGDKQRQTIRVILELDKQYHSKLLGDQLSSSPLPPTPPSSTTTTSTLTTSTIITSGQQQQQQQNGHIIIKSSKDKKVDASNDFSLTYSPGDHLGIFPENSPTLVKGIRSRLSKIDFTTIYQIMVRKSGDDNTSGGGGGNSDEYAPHEKLPACSMEEALTRYLDITTPPTQQLLSLLTSFCKDNGQKSLMEKLANDSERYEEWKAHQYPNLLELLTQFDSLDPPAEIILTQLPILQPRFYSISSSNKYYTWTSSKSSSSSSSLPTKTTTSSSNTINHNFINSNNISSSSTSSSSSSTSTISVQNTVSTNGHSPISSADNSSSSFLIDSSSVVDITGSPRRPGTLYKEPTLSLFSLLSKFTGFETTSNHSNTSSNQHHHHHQQHHHNQPHHQNQSAINNTTNYLNNYNSSSITKSNNNNNNNNHKEKSNDSNKQIIANANQIIGSTNDKTPSTTINTIGTNDNHSDEGETIRIDLTVAVVSYTTGSGAQHYGVCSNFLANIKDGHQVYGFLRSAPNFRMPDDHSVPIIMVGPGTGIAPFRAFWLERYADGLTNPILKSSFGKMSLYFGCRLPFMELYSDETRTMMREKILTTVKVAYSRVAGQPKRYVQDELRSSAKEVLHQLMKEKGHLYVCGDVSMAEGVSQTLRTLLSEAGYEDPDGVIMYLRSDNRYHEDIFGITLRTDEVRRKGRDNALNRKSASTV